MSYSLFVHSHRFRKIGGNYYSTGGLSNDVLSRYIKNEQELKVLARVVEAKNIDPKFSLISNPNIQIINYEKLSKKELSDYVKNSKIVILRLPCFICNKVYKYVKRFNKNFLVEVVGCALDSYWNYNLLGKIIAPFMFGITRKIVKKAPNVLYVTNEFLQKRYPNINNNIGCSDVELFEINNDILARRSQRNKNNNKIILGTIGTIDVKYKGQEYVINALKLLKAKGYTNIEYQMVGPGSDSILKKMAIKKGVLEEVKFIGTLPHEDIFMWLDTIDIYIQPSNTEGLCRSLIEAMSRGCACIASDAGGNPELLTKNSIFKRKNVKDLEKKLLYLMNNKTNEQEKRNFEKAKEFQKNVLEKKREAFYRDIELY